MLKYVGNIDAIGRSVSQLKEIKLRGNHSFELLTARLGKNKVLETNGKQSKAGFEQNTIKQAVCEIMISVSLPQPQPSVSITSPDMRRKGLD